MKISVVTAVRNGRATLPAMLESLRCQTYENYEHIVQDGASTDGTKDYLLMNGLDAMSLQTLSDDGIYDGINRGIARATGDIVGLLHADDELAGPDVLAQIAEALQDRSVDGVYGDLQYVAHADPTKVLRHWKAGSFGSEALRKGWMPPHPTLYLRRDVFTSLGPYDTSFQISGDYDGILRFLTAGGVRLAYIPQVMVRMKSGGASNRSVRHILRKTREDYRAIKRHRVGGVGTLVSKNLRKLPQFFDRGQV